MSVPGFQPREAYELALQNLDPGLERRPARDAVAFLGGRPGEPHAAVEVAAAIDRSERAAEEQLDEMVAAGTAVRTPVSLGVLWSSGPSVYRLDGRSDPRR